MEPERSKFLPCVGLNLPWRVRSRAPLAGNGVAACAAHGLRPRNAPTALANHNDDRAFVVELLGFRRPNEHRPVRHERGWHAYQETARVLAAPCRLGIRSALR